jgi:DisA bacterial checkpoint controller nucleotide-binding
VVGAIARDAEVAVAYALGVILDGSASNQGDRGRGARFNSALRYLTQPAAATMIILVSEDGMIDVLPRLRPRISRRIVDSALASYQRLTTAGDGDAESDLTRRPPPAVGLPLNLGAVRNGQPTGKAEYEQRRLESGGFSITGRALAPTRT